jgi:hypothetical protein
MKVTAKILKAQINSQCKRENLKIWYRKEILNANKHAPEGVATHDLSIDTKKIPQNLSLTILCFQNL